MACDRIAIVGKPGSGKTTLAQQLANILQLKHIELDAIYWQPNWVKIEKSLMQERVGKELPASGRWVADGNYIAVREIVWGRADTAIWLDYPLLLTLWRLLRRTLSRYFLREELWQGNREKLIDHLTFNKEKNLFLYTIGVHTRHRAQFPVAFRKPEFGHLKVLRFRHPRELEEWLASLTRSRSDTAHG